MAHEDSTAGSGWDGFFSQAQDLVFDFAKAKLAAEVRPPAPGPYPAPTRPPRSSEMPDAYYAAQGDEVSQVLADIFSSPRTWVGIAAIAVLVVVFVKMRR